MTKRTIYVFSNLNRYYRCDQTLKGNDWAFDRPIFDCLVAGHDTAGLTEKGIQVDLGFTTLDPIGPKYEWIIGTGLISQTEGGAS